MAVPVGVEPTSYAFRGRRNEPLYYRTISYFCNAISRGAASPE